MAAPWIEQARDITRRAQQKRESDLMQQASGGLWGTGEGLYGISTDPVYQQYYDQLRTSRLQGLGQAFTDQRARMMEEMAATGRYGGGYMGAQMGNLGRAQAMAKAQVEGGLDLQKLQDLLGLRREERGREFEWARAIQDYQNQLALMRKQQQMQEPGFFQGFGNLLGVLGGALPFFLGGGAPTNPQPYGPSYTQWLQS